MRKLITFQDQRYDIKLHLVLDRYDSRARGAEAEIFIGLTAHRLEYQRSTNNLDSGGTTLVPQGLPGGGETAFRDASDDLLCISAV